MITFNVIHAYIIYDLSADGILTISGTDMPNYSSQSPWYYQRGIIKKVIIETGVTNIGDYAFHGCESLTSIEIPNSVTSIGVLAFSACYSLPSITIPNSVTNIADYAFSNCESLTSATIPNSVTSIGKSTFHNCSSLTSIAIPNSVTNIGDNAFSDCSCLISVTIPNSVTSIGSQAFYECSGLTSVTIPNSVTSIGNHAFYGCKSLTSIIIPNSMTSIGNYAFYDCSSLTSVTIPNSVTSIGNYAFYGCSKLTSITIPNSVTGIGSYAFYGCSGLTSLTCEATNPPKYGEYCFCLLVNQHIPLYVPKNSINVYQDQWKNFPYILPISVEPTIALTLTDKISGLTKGHYKKAEITYTRNNMSVGDYATFCLPFDIDLRKTAKNFSKVYMPLNIGFLKPSGNLLLLLEEVNDNSIIKAGQIFVVKSKTKNVKFENCAGVSFGESTPNPNSSSINIYNFDGVSGALTQNNSVKIKIGGTYSQFTNLNKNNYYTLFANGTFGSATKITPFQMYVNIDNNSSLGSKITSISFEFTDMSTDIKELRMANEESPTYDLNGRMVNKSTLKSGIYIRNGKKVVVR